MHGFHFWGIILCGETHHNHNIIATIATIAISALLLPATSANLRIAIITREATILHIAFLDIILFFLLNILSISIRASSSPLLNLCHNPATPHVFMVSQVPAYFFKHGHSIRQLRLKAPTLEFPNNLPRSLGAISLEAPCRSIACFEGSSCTVSDLLGVDMGSIRNSVWATLFVCTRRLIEEIVPNCSRVS